MLKRYLRNPIVIALEFRLWSSFSGLRFPAGSFSSLIRASTSLFQPPRHRL